MNASRIDTHVHLWDPTQGYAWLAEEGLDLLQRPFTPRDLRAHLKHTDALGAVLVQADDTAEDTAAMLRIAAQVPEVLGVVMWGPLDRPAALNTMLGQANEHVVGVRQIDRIIADGGGPGQWWSDPEVTAGLHRVAAHNLSVDVIVQGLDDLHGLVDAVERGLPGRFVLDHAASPPADPTDQAGWAAWEAEVARLASFPQIFVKLSGAGTWGWPSTYDESRTATAVHLLQRMLGSDRLLYGSDWPVCLLGEPIANVCATVEAAVEAEAGADGLGAVIGHTALSAYPRLLQPASSRTSRRADQ